MNPNSFHEYIFSLIFTKSSHGFQLPTFYWRYRDSFSKEMFKIVCFLTFRDWIIWPNTRDTLPKNAVLFGRTPHARLLFPTKVRVFCLLFMFVCWFVCLFVCFVCLFEVRGAISSLKGQGADERWHNGMHISCNTIGWLYCQRTLAILLASVLLVAFSWTSLPITTGEKKSIAHSAAMGSGNGSERSPAAYFFLLFLSNQVEYSTSISSRMGW